MDTSILCGILLKKGIRMKQTQGHREGLVVASISLNGDSTVMTFTGKRAMGRWVSQRPAARVECAKELLRGEVTDVTKDYFEDGIIQGFDNYMAAHGAVTETLKVKTGAAVAH